MKDATAQCFADIGESKNKKWLEAINKDHNAILGIPKELWTDRLCLAAVKRDYAAIHFMPIEHFTKEICIEAYKQSPSAIRYVAKDLRELYHRYIAEAKMY